MYSGRLFLRAMRAVNIMTETFKNMQAPYLGGSSLGLYSEVIVDREKRLQLLLGLPDAIHKFDV